MKENIINNNKFSLAETIEALLFVSSMPISVGQLSTITGEAAGKIKASINELEEKYKQTSGLRIQHKGSKVQITTAPELSEVIDAFMGIETTATLSRASLETLAIIAFRQPISRPSIEEVRGVNSDGVVRNLLSKGLVEELGRSESLGRAVLYGTSADFLSHFGLNSLEDLPTLNLPDDVHAKEAKILKE